MKKNSSLLNIVINSMFCGICIGAVLSLPMIILAIQFNLSLLLSTLSPIAFFGIVISLSTASLWMVENSYLY